MIKERVVFVTGSTKGIGLSIAKKFLSKGCFVILNSRNEDDKNEIINNLGGDKVDYIPGDLTNKFISNELISEIRSKYKKLDVLVCNVGKSNSESQRSELWEEMFMSNFYSATNVIESATDSLERSKGSVVCISSICGIEEIPGAPIEYSVAKAALNSYVKLSSKKLGRKGIRINAVAPGNIIFKNSVWDLKMRENSNSVEQMLNNEVPLNRLGNPDEISNLVAWLASDEASFVTGSVMVADGGQTRVM